MGFRLAPPATASRARATRLKLTVYDLDGTLIDSRADLADSVNAMLARMGLPRHEDRVVLGFVGEGAERLIRRALGLRHEDRYAEAAPVWREEYGRRLLAKTRLYDGIDDVLRAGPQLRAVLTNKPGGFARDILRGLGVDGAFAEVIGGDEGPRKPDPANLLRLCARFGIQKDEALMVGDSAVDIGTAAAAHVPSCAVLWGLGEEASLAAADFHCRSPGELSALLTHLTLV